MITLKSLFESQCDQLEEKLSGLKLPEDSQKVQGIVSDYLNKLLEDEGDFRQNLTQAEDYILQASLSLLSAQQTMVKELNKNSNSSIRSTTFEKASKENPLRPTKVISNNQTIGGTAIGSTAGALLFGTWGAVFGAIAGTAIVLYYASNQSSVSDNKEKQSTEKPLLPTSTAIDVKLFTNIVRNICESVDSIIETFRAQINRVVHKYGNQEKPTLEREYRFLLEGIQSLLGYERTHSADDEKYVKKLQIRIEDIAELLENYNLSVENYSEECEHWFEKVVSPETKEIRMVYPAIVKDGQAVLKGKVFVCE